MNADTVRGEVRRPLAIAPAIRSSAEWKPEPCGLTREQIRTIVIEQIG